MLHILMIAAEAVPFVKTGGLADVIGSLPKSLRQLGADVRVMLPKYEDMGQDWASKATLLASFTVQVGWRRQYCGVEMITHDGITYYLLDNEYYFKRRGLYGYGDDGERFAFFCEAVLESLPRLDWQPDILHAHDWHCALVPVFLRAHYGQNSWYAQLKTMFTIHNLHYQGIFGYEIMNELLNLGNEHFHANGLEHYGNVNWMKGAINYSDCITTVSPTYAEEIQTPYYGESLDGTLRARKDRLFGIINGLDTELYDPMLDQHIPTPYRKSLLKKAANKLALQAELGLPTNKEIPIIAIVTRLVEQKGIDLMTYILETLLREEAQWVILGTGEAHYEKRFRDAAYHHPEQLSAQIKFDEGLARRIYAGSDLFLMPSRFEPCGIGQMIAMRYCTVPIVRETGGLIDTVEPYNEFTGEGHGFTFHQYNAHDMLSAIQQALRLFQSPEHWHQIINNMTRQDFSWHRSARKYLQQYESLMSI
jgi:starch synthase